MRGGGGSLGYMGGWGQASQIHPPAKRGTIQIYAPRQVKVVVFIMECRVPLPASYALVNPLACMWLPLHFYAIYDSLTNTVVHAFIQIYS
jgi:hypothetical protein